VTVQKDISFDKQNNVDTLSIIISPGRFNPQTGVAFKSVMEEIRSGRFNATNTERYLFKKKYYHWRGMCENSM